MLIYRNESLRCRMLAEEIARELRWYSDPIWISTWDVDCHVGWLWNVLPQKSRSNRMARIESYPDPDWSCLSGDIILVSRESGNGWNWCCRDHYELIICRDGSSKNTPIHQNVP
jgi:hypothetical protein